MEFAYEKQLSSSARPAKCPRQARAAVTLDAIFEGTIQVLLSVGSTRLNTTRVAERAGVSVGTLYQYFPNKQALLFAVLERYLAKLMDTLEAACDGHQGATSEFMTEAAVKAYLQVKAQHPEVSRALYLIAIELDARGLVEAARQLTMMCRSYVAATIQPEEGVSR